LIGEAVVVLAGRCLDSQQCRQSGGGATPLDLPTLGIVLFNAESVQAARSIMDAVPGVSAGVFKARLNPFRPAFTDE